MGGIGKAVLSSWAGLQRALEWAYLLDSALDLYRAAVLHGVLIHEDLGGWSATWLVWRRQNNTELIDMPCRTAMNLNFHEIT